MVGEEEDLRCGASRGGGGGERRAFASDEGHVLTGAGPFFISKSKQAACGGLGVMGKEETVMLIRPAHTSSSNKKTKQDGKHRKATDNWGGPGCAAATVLHVTCRTW